MNSRSAMRNAWPVLLCAAMLGCGGQSSSGPGTMSVHLIDGPDPAYQQVLLQVSELAIHGPTGWEVLATFSPAKQVDLLSLRGVDDKGLPIKATLVDGKALPEGHYDQMRLKLADGNKLVFADGSSATLTVPSGTQTGVKFPVSFDVAPGTTRDVFIDMDAHRSIFVHEAGNSGKYMLRPVVHAVDRLVTGSISGKLTATVSTGSAPLAGVDVLAETLATDGHPLVVRSTTTAADGTYVLDLLPAGATYYVVAQPITPATTSTPKAVYPPQASGALAISESTPTATYSQSFVAVAAAAVGSVSGSVSLAATSDTTKTVTDEINVLGSFGGTTLVVRTEPAAVSTTGETYQVNDLPLWGAGYSLAVERATLTIATGDTTYAWKADAATPFLKATDTVLAVTRNLTAP